MPTLIPYFGKILTPGHRRANTSINLTGAVADSDLFRYREPQLSQCQPIRGLDQCNYQPIKGLDQSH